MGNWDEDKEIMQLIFEKDINLYDSEEAGKTCQKVFVNGAEVNINDFKRGKEKNHLKYYWKRKQNGIDGRIGNGVLPFYKDND